ncbi:MAG: HTH-type transcriptional regulator Cbl [Tolumonas sp.]|nr:HTH-type transcriptional regulator Cbl [Tolumonas sp.]
MNFQQLKIIREAARCHFNLTEVANTLYTSQSGVSRHIKELEDELGVELFIRRGKRLLGMTEPGKALLTMAERILTEANNIRRLADNFTNSDRGRLHVATTHTQARYALPGIIKEFRTQYPQVQLSLHQGSPSEIVSMLLSGETDIGLTSELMADYDEIAAFPYYSWHHTILVPRGHPLTELPQVTLEDLSAWPLITYQTGLTGRTKIDAAFAMADIEPDIVLSAQDSDVIKTYVELGLGVGILADMAIDSVKDSNLVRISAEHLFPANTAWFGLKKGKLQPNFAWRFLQLCNPALAISDIQAQVFSTGDVQTPLHYEI